MIATLFSWRCTTLPTILEGNHNVSDWRGSLLPWKCLPPSQTSCHIMTRYNWTLQSFTLRLPHSNHDFPSDMLRFCFKDEEKNVSRVKITESHCCLSYVAVTHSCNISITGAPPLVRQQPCRELLEPTFIYPLIVRCTSWHLKIVLFCLVSYPSYHCFTQGMGSPSRDVNNNIFMVE